VAIKLLERLEATASSSGRAAERFRRETQICAGLSHPNIVRLIDAGETRAGRLYAVFEHVPGDTLATTLEREGALGPLRLGPAVPGVLTFPPDSGPGRILRFVAVREEGKAREGEATQRRADHLQAA
jgi:hypothetical protein